MRAAFLLAGACLLLALAPARADEEEPAAGAPSDAAAAPAPDAALNPLSRLDKASLEAFRETPLFTPSRRRPKPPEAAEAEPPPPPPPPPAPEPAPPPEITLSGIIDGPDGAIAVVNEADEERTDRLRLGDQIDGWLVTTIDPMSLRLTLGEREQEYRLFEKKDEDDAAAAASPPVDAMAPPPKFRPGAPAGVRPPKPKPLND